LKFFLVMLTFLNLCLVCLSVWFAYKSGITGDIKTASCGNPVEALEYESIGLLFSLIASVGFGVVFYIKSSASLLLRILKGFSATIIVLIILYIISWQVHNLGVIES
jgi:hypothetical protein